MIFTYFLLLINLSFFLSLKKISEILNIYDIPDGKLKLHRKKIPSIGGLILATNFFIIFVYQIFFSKDFLFLDLELINKLEVFSILFLIYSYFFLGLYDDKFRLTPIKKLFLSIFIILIAVSLNKNLIVSNFSLSFYENRIFFENFSIVFTIFCILTLTNALNFYDGINGQSCLIFIFFFSYLLMKSNFHFFYLISIIIILIIMFMNFKNLLFLGDSGIYLLSGILSISLIYEYNIQKSILYVDEIFFLLLLPGFDLIRLTIIRLINNKNVFHGDRNHIHHLLTKRYSLFFSNLILFSLSIFPIILFVFLKFNFYFTFSTFFVIYFSLIQFLKVNDKG